MNDIHKKCKELFDRLMREEITQEEFERELKKLEQPPQVNWGEEGQ